MAVDLDELARIGEEGYEAPRKTRADRTKSFDDMVGSDGMLKGDAQTTGKDSTENGLRKRGAAGFAAGAATAVAMTNPFDDDAVLFDHDTEEEATSPKPFTYVEPNTATRESTATLAPSSPAAAAAGTLIDLTPDSKPAHPSPTNDTTTTTPLTPPTPAADPEIQDPELAAQSFYSFTSSPSPPSLFI